MPPLLMAAIPGLITGAAGAGLSSLRDGREQKNKEKLATIHQTAPGFNTFGGDLASPDAAPPPPAGLTLDPLTLGKKKPMMYGAPV